MQFTENELKAYICRKSFWEFVKEFWDTYIHEPLIENWHMEYLCNILQAGAERVFKNQPKHKDILINIAPGSTKSTITSSMFPVWCWTKAPWIQTICGSYEQPLAIDLSTKARQIVNSEKYQTLFPNIILSKDQNTKTYFENTNSGWRLSVTTGGSTGRHGHIIIIDDPINPKKATSDAELKTAESWLTDTLPTRKVSKDNTLTIMIMQRLAQNDPSALWLGWQKKGLPIEHICIPAEITDDIKPKKLKRFYINGLMDPIRFSRKKLDEYKSMGEYSYAGQFLQNPIPPGGGIFKTSKIEILNIDYKNQKGWTLYRYWDKAYSKDSGAFTVGVLMGRDPNGVFWVLDVVRGQWASEEREEIIRQTAQKDGIKVIIKVEQEPAAGKESVQATIKNLAGFNASADNPRNKGSKVFRADPYASQVNIGNVKLLKADWNDEYLKELSFFPNSTYKDQVDASSGAFSFLNQKQLYIGSLR